MIFQRLIDIYDLENMSVVCKMSNRVLNDTEQGRQLWLNLGIQATAGGIEGFDEGYIRQRFKKEVHGRHDFFWHLRLLVCPWQCDGRDLPVQVDGMDFNAQFLFFEDKDETRLHMQGPTDHAAALMATSFPARMLSCDEEDIQSFVSQIKTGREWVNNPQSFVLNHQLEQQVAQHLVVPDFSHDRGCTHRYFPIHAGAFAVAESFSPFFDNDELSDHGIYFISHLSRRVLRHIKLDSAFDVFRFSIISRPFEMWIMTCREVFYHGPSCAPNLDDQERVCGLVDEALWMAGMGNARRAIDHMAFYGIELDRPGMISNRTLLHYAAKEGHTEAVRLLLRSGFSAVDSVDDFSHTALFLAVSELHLDVVEVLLKEGNANPLAGEPCLSNVGEFVRFRPYAVSADRIKDEITRIVPGIVRLLLDKDPGVVEHSDFEFYFQESIFSSPEAVRMLCDAGCKPTMEDVCLQFGNFRNRIRELSAVKTLYMLVREFDMDINNNNNQSSPVLLDGMDRSSVVSSSSPSSSRRKKEPVISFLAQNAISEAVIMAIDNLGADPSTTSISGKTIRQIALDRANRRPVDIEGRRIIAYLDARGF